MSFLSFPYKFRCKSFIILFSSISFPIFINSFNCIPSNSTCLPSFHFLILLFPVLSHFFLRDSLTPSQSSDFEQTLFLHLLDFVLSFHFSIPKGFLLFTLSYLTFHSHQTFHAASHFPFLFDSFALLLPIFYFWWSQSDFINLNEVPSLGLILIIIQDLITHFDWFSGLFITETLTVLRLGIEFLVLLCSVRDFVNVEISMRFLSIPRVVYQLRLAWAVWADDWKMLQRENWVSASGKDLVRDAECAECGEIVSVEEAILLPCHHPIHRKCIKKAMWRAGKCPRCGVDLRNCDRKEVVYRPTFNFQDLAG
jgi:hypothetical protein